MLKSKYSAFELECGIDEAGRGCLAGPVTAAAVILKPDFYHKLIDDSKKLSMTDREKLSKIIPQVSQQNYLNNKSNNISKDQIYKKKINNDEFYFYKSPKKKIKTAFKLIR